MTKEEFYDNMMEKLDNNLALTKRALENGDTLGAPTQMDAVEMATRCVSGDKQHMVEFRNNPNFRTDLMTRVMQVLKDCKLNNDKHYMLRAVKYCPEVAIQYVSDRLREDPQFLLEAIEANRDVANLPVVQELQAENPNFAKQVQSRTGDSRKAKEAKLAALQARDNELTDGLEEQKGLLKNDKIIESK